MSVPRHHVRYAGVITAVAVLSGYASVLPIFRNDLESYLGIGDGSFGLLFSIGPLAGLVGLLAGGVLIDRWGPRRVIRVGLAGVGCGMLIIAFGGRSFASFAAAIGVSGAFSSPLSIAMSAYLGRLFPRHKRAVLSLNLAVSSAGGMAFPLVAEALLRLSRTSTVTFARVLHLPFLLVGALILAASFLYRARGFGSASAAPPIAVPFGRRWRDMMLPQRTVVLTVLVALHGTADATLFIWMPRFLESSSFNVHVIAPGVVLSGYALAYLLSRTALALLPERTGQRLFLVLPGLLGGGILLAAILSRSSLLTAGGYVVGAFCWSVESPTQVSRLLHHDRRRFGASMAAAGLLGGLLSFLALNGIGLLVERAGDASMWKAMLVPASWFTLVGASGLAWVLLFDRAPGNAAVTSS
jgi:hypothetical protein